MLQQERVEILSLPRIGAVNVVNVVNVGVSHGNLAPCIYFKISRGTRSVSGLRAELFGAFSSFSGK